jgi:hypothetical protein
MADLLKELTHYVCWKVQDDPSRLGATKLNKALWFADTIAYRANGRSITNATYVKRQFGPVPKRILPILQQLSDEHKIVIREIPYLNQVKRDFIAIAPPTEALFSEEERLIIDAVVSWVCDRHTAASISDLSHDCIWAAAEEGEEIPLYAVLGASPGEITDADKEWASRIISSR